ncbi:hypothetical protein PPL_00367 [Heterostelium album PN500]|uniref:Uncharacterized protein n=1 Tax=Heterostelium pallidum (strain ATCC 26659 / Pp 5 / PN500) TaxID=670386 RepID=D3AW93_HETP5|nr:hypothetical protein PPL_00367 [Heterostelium album PN500]EFA86566.1 hypothetical protein PPL_00367 [Heterostelium album PN500]|eukprot:XP_020438671.1 hypothetical protein PPL_00367 [Heterostelium album PN500]
MPKSNRHLYLGINHFDKYIDDSNVRVTPVEDQNQSNHTGIATIEYQNGSNLNNIDWSENDSNYQIEESYFFDNCEDNNRFEMEYMFQENSNRSSPFGISSLSGKTYQKNSEEIKYELHSDLKGPNAKFY